MTIAIRRSKLGLGLVAIRDDEDKAAGIGVVTPVYKNLAFMASAVLVGMAGAVYGYYVSILSVSSMFDIALSMQIVLAALLGGRGTVWGPVLGAFIVVPLTEVTNTTLGGEDAGAIRLLMYGGLLIAVALLMPRGILPTASDLLRRWRGDRRGESHRQPPRRRRTDTGRARRAVGSRSPPAMTKALRHLLLALHDVTMRFGGVTALDHVDLEIAQGSITALIGPNGSGKTTLFNIVDGTYQPDQGEVALSGPTPRTA